VAAHPASTTQAIIATITQLIFPVLRLLSPLPGNQQYFDMTIKQKGKTVKNA